LIKKIGACAKYVKTVNGVRVPFIDNKLSCDDKAYLPCLARNEDGKIYIYFFNYVHKHVYAVDELLLLFTRGMRARVSHIDLSLKLRCVYIYLFFQMLILRQGNNNMFNQSSLVHFQRRAVSIPVYWRYLFVIIYSWEIYSRTVNNYCTRRPHTTRFRV